MNPPWNVVQNIIAYTDGASRGNPGPGGWGVIILFPKNGSVEERGGRKDITTNNEMELMAVRELLHRVQSWDAPVTIYTDSSYVMKGCTTWRHAWKKKSWTTANNKKVLHERIWQDIDKYLSVRSESGAVTFVHVPGHAGVPGNERADVIATMYADNKPIDIYNGSLAEYPHGDMVTPPKLMSTDKPTSVLKKKSQLGTGKAHAYLSCLNRSVVRHQTWQECKDRVSGKNAHFRKALSEEHIGEIIAEWRKLGYC